MSKSKKSWESRLSSGPDAMAVDFVESLGIDQRLYKYDIVGSIAHAQMLSERGMITKAEFKQIKDGLIEISEQIAQGKFKFDKTCEDIHMAIEAALIKNIGDAGKKLHTGRSRNDQVATDLRLWMRDQIEILQAKLTRLQKAFVKLADKYKKNLMPGYTHLQRAQPVCVGAYLLSFVEMFERDNVRLGNCSALLNVSPLGSGALAGTTLDLSREDTAVRLGFPAISTNSIDTVSDRDFCAEFIFDCSLIAVHLSRLAEAWILYSTSEFDFIRIDDSFCTSSSMMPQKRNPDMLELIRGKTGRVTGALMAMLMLLKAQPSGYNRDMQEDKVHVFNASDTVEACVDMAEAIVLHTTFSTKKIEAGLDKGFLDATALAEYLVKKEIPFRQAHQFVGTIVADCEKKNMTLSQLSLDDYKKLCDVISDDVYDSLGAVNVAANYLPKGSAGTKQVAQQIGYWRKRLDQR